MANLDRDRHLEKWAARLNPADTERFWIVVAALRLKFAERDYTSAETYRLSTEFERLQAKGRRAQVDTHGNRRDVKQARAARLGSAVGNADAPNTPGSQESWLNG